MSIPSRFEAPNGVPLPPSPRPRWRLKPPFHPFRLAYLLLAAVFLRKGILLIPPVLYVWVMLSYVGSLGEEGGVVLFGKVKAPAGAVYRSNLVFERVWPSMERDGGNSSLALATAWHPKVGDTWKPCALKKTDQAELPSSNGFLIVEANGGLNQQRLSGCLMLHL